MRRTTYIKLYFSNWSVSKILHGIIALSALSLLLFYWMNVPISTSSQVTGTVISKGIFTASLYELPGPIITTKLKNGEDVTTGIPRHIKVNIGDKVVLSKSKLLISDSDEYKFISVSE